MIGKTIKEIKLGEKAEFIKTISESDINIFAEVTCDFNPLHIDDAYAKKTYFKSRIAHGMLLAGFISKVIGNQLPGYGTVYLKQELNFHAPVYIGDTIQAQVEVIELMEDKKQIRLKTVCINQFDKIVLDGEAIVSPPRVSIPLEIN